ncbi:hypothetical protein ACS7SF_23215 (plasmid) [Ralstonia sp. 25C]|uniref:hypothetical protein n=1 Tax=Ralstonia sp. 25C TaxID=3447363 RepID=UPI003F74EC5A
MQALAKAFAVCYAAGGNATASIEVGRGGPGRERFNHAGSIENGYPAAQKKRRKRPLTSAETMPKSRVYAAGKETLPFW